MAGTQGLIAACRSVTCDKSGLDTFTGFCSIYCREEYFSNLGAGDIRRWVRDDLFEIPSDRAFGKGPRSSQEDDDDDTV